MPQYLWTGLGVAEGTTVTSGNINTTGNGDTMSFVATSGTITRVFDRDAGGNGIDINGSAGSLGRLDTPTIAGGAECMAVQFLYVAGTPTTDDDNLIVGRNANATPAFSGFLEHRTDATLIAQNSAGSLIAASATPALVAANVYQIDYAIIRNTLTTPSTSNGRVLLRVRSITAPGTWNGGAEFFHDTGYTVNVTVDKTNIFRWGKTGTACAHAFKTWNFAWKDLASPNTSTVKADAITNFVQSTGPTVSTTGTGKYPIVNVGTAVVGGALSYSITQTGGTTHAATTPVAGVYLVDQDSSAATTYDVTVSEVGGGSTITTHTVPAASTTTSGQFRRRKRVAGAWV
jgi:hypothetical protein